LTARLFHPSSEVWKPHNRLFVANSAEHDTWCEVEGWFEIEEISAAASPPRIKFREVNDRERARRISGKGIWVDRSLLPPLGPDEVYLADLIGLEVVDAGGAVLGRVTSIAKAGMQEFLVVEGGGAGSQWIPTTAGFLSEVDVGAGRLRLAVELGGDGRFADSGVE
jgi:16S rRNA processing protein RimM